MNVYKNSQKLRSATNTFATKHVLDAGRTVQCRPMNPDSGYT